MGQVQIFSIINDFYQTQSISRIKRNFSIDHRYNTNFYQSNWPDSKTKHAFTSKVENSVDPDQKPAGLDLHCF